MVVNTLSSLNAAWNKIYPTEKVTIAFAKSEKPRKCRICGSEMEHIVGSNVYVCHGMKTVPDKDSNIKGATKEVPCTNFALARS